jgi:hypothetical protein
MPHPSGLSRATSSDFKLGNKNKDIATMNFNFFILAISPIAY